MKYEFKIQGIHCGHCASKIEDKLSRENMFSNVILKFMLEKIEVETEELNQCKVIKKIEDVANTIAESVTVTDVSMEHTKKKTFAQEDYKIWIRVGISLFLIMVGSVLPRIGLAKGYKPLNVGLFFAYGVSGYDVLKKGFTKRGKEKLFDEYFLMSIATIAAFLIGEYAEAVAVMFFYQIGEYFQQRAVRQSKKAIASLMDLAPTVINVKRGERWVEESPEFIQEGDLILIKPGERIPLDGIITKGATTIDTSKLTGESLPTYKGKGESVLSGTINRNRLIEVKVTHTLQNSTVSHILELIENATSKKAQTEHFMTKFARIYTPIVVGLALIIGVLPGILTGEWERWIYTSITFLVISCPCALVVSIPLSFFAGIGRASKEGILIKGSNFLEMLGTIDTVVMDKTGTLTKGNFEVVEIQAIDCTKEVVLKYAAMLEYYSNHPVAKAIVSEYCRNNPKIQPHLDEYSESVGTGVIGRIDETIYAVGNDRLMERLKIPYEPCKTIGSIVYMAINGQCKGWIVVADVVKEESFQAIQVLRERGIKHLVMLTGDREDVAHKVAKEVGITKVYAQLLPQDKVDKVQELVARGHRVAFVGDGMNDAPVLATAHIGIAMGEIGSDVAVEASDVVLMTDHLGHIAKAMKIASKTRWVVIQNITVVLGIKFLVMGFGLLGIANMWLAVFADVGVSLIVILNAMRMLRQR